MYICQAVDEHFIFYFGAFKGKHKPSIVQLPWPETKMSQIAATNMICMTENMDIEISLDFWTQSTQSQSS